MTGADVDADVIVVGAGPGGATAAYHLAQAGVNVVALEKSQFPREKVCGDGLTPRAVKQLIAMGIDTAPEQGWIRNHGLRILGGGMRIEVPWPDLQTFPSYGLVRPRQDFDEVLARAAQKAGAQLHENTTVTEPIRNERTGRVEGVRTRDGQTYRAPLVLVADGNSSRFSSASGFGSAATGRWVSRIASTSVRRATTTTGSSRGWSCGTASQARRAAGCSPATAGYSASVTAPAMSGSASSTPPTRSARPTTGRCSTGGWRTCRRSGALSRRTPPGPRAARRCRWASTASRTTPTARY